MQTEFKFLFSTYDFVFEKDYKFEGVIGDENEPFRFGDETGKLKFEVNVVRERSKDRGEATQKGSLIFRVPLHYEEGKEIIFDLVYLVSQQINFNNVGKFEVNTAFYVGERIPETEEEIKEVADKPCFAQMSVIEYIGEPSFNVDQFLGHAFQSSMDFELIHQHNHAAQAKHPIDKYLSYYKIMEDIFSSKEKISAKSLLNNELLKEIYNSAFETPKDDNDYLEFVSTIVDVRHKCSHLKRNSDFGYVINDKRIEYEVEQYLDLMHYITYQLIVGINQGDQQ